MRFGIWRGVALAFALSTAMLTGPVGSIRAFGFGHVIPREVVAVDLNTGGPFLAPPVPYGCYAKDCGGHLAGCLGMMGCLLHGCHGCRTCDACGGKGCDACGGQGVLCGHGHGLGLCRRGCGEGCGNPCVACGGKGCGFCHGMGMLKKGCCGGPCGGSGCGHGGKVGHCGKGGLCGGAGCGPTLTSPQAPGAQSTSRGSFASGQCGDPGCKLTTRHFHRRGHGCTACDGKGCGFCKGGLLSGKLCGGCRGAGCGLCGGRGLFHCGDPCQGCGGRGCKLCSGLGHLRGIPSSLLGKLCHRGEIKYFLGAGGPVPLTPGYVPYVVATRSPRDFFAFPPFVDIDP